MNILATPIRNLAVWYVPSIRTLHFSVPGLISSPASLLAVSFSFQISIPEDRESGVSFDKFRMSFSARSVDCRIECRD